MNTDLKAEDILIQIRSKLQQNDVKLWLPPYYEPSIGSIIVEIENLAKTYSECLHIPIESCVMAVTELQEHALDKLKERNKFKDTGIATLKIRISSSMTGLKLFNVEMNLKATGLDLKDAVSLRVNLPSNRLKLISRGHVLIDDNELVNQNIKNCSQIMAVVLHDNPDNLKETENQLKELESVKADAKLLANKCDSYMNLEDQFGNAVTLPDNEQKSLLMAMALHEKGRAALKKEDYSLALVMFLDADKEFCQCQSSILETVDNYALLNLDIAWCYLCLKSVSQIPEAEQRLLKCEASFQRSYGKNLERLIALKGTTGNETILFMRLHLLQAIIKYHQNQRNEALQLLLRAEAELNALRVDENSVMVLIELGYSAAEARLGLRATHGDVNAAAGHIDSCREQRATSRKRALEEWLVNKERRRLGRCADGKQYVEPKFVRMLQNMGYPKETARRALQQSNNNVSLSIQVIQDNPQLLEVAGSSSTESLAHLVTDLLPQLEAAGFDAQLSRQALERHSGDLFKAIEELLNPSASFSEDDPSVRQRELEAYERLAKDMPSADDDHLDFTLTQEENFLQQYKTLLLPDA